MVESNASDLLSNIAAKPVKSSDCTGLARSGGSVAGTVGFSGNQVNQTSNARNGMSPLTGSGGVSGNVRSKGLNGKVKVTG
jgi:hypothetical protein